MSVHALPDNDSSSGVFGVFSRKGKIFYLSVKEETFSIRVTDGLFDERGDLFGPIYNPCFGTKETLNQDEQTLIELVYGKYSSIYYMVVDFIGMFQGNYKKREDEAKEYLKEWFSGEGHEF